MNFHSLSLKWKMLLSFTVLILVMMTGNIFLTSGITRNALTDNLNSSLEVMCQIAADGVTTGLEFDDPESVASAVASFRKEELFSYIMVQDRQGRSVYEYRKPGLRPVNLRDIDLESERDNEIFSSTSIISNSENIGKVTVGVCLDTRDEALSAARAANMMFTLLIIAVFSVVTVVIANFIVKPMANMSNVAHNIAKGNLEQEVNLHSGDEIGELASSFRKMIGSTRDKADAANQIAMGNLEVEVKAESDKDLLGQAMVTMRDRLREMLQDLADTIQAQKSGELDVRCHADKHEGAFAELLQSVNELLDAVVTPMSESAEILECYSRGDLNREMRDLPGKQMILTESINTIRSNLQLLIDEGLMLADAAREGKLETRGDTDKFEGSYRDVIKGMNETVENILKPVKEALYCLTEMEQGDLTVTVSSDYKGDHVIMKTAVNSTLDGLNDILNQVMIAVQQVSSGANQVSDSSQVLSKGATEQASSLQEITTTMQQISSQTSKNAENASEANGLAESACGSASDGNQQMKKMLSAMNEINRASVQISKIIKAIDEIAFQTNLLSLNAAVEAARAGVHGKGFAVVAEEVRNLAQRSAKAARETTELIEDTVSKVEHGTKIANATATSLGEIVGGVTKVTELIGEIAVACNEQAQGINQINSGLLQVDHVTQANTANAEETASAAEELTSQADHVKQALGSFKLRDNHLMAGKTRTKANITVVDTEPVSDDTLNWGGVAPDSDHDSDGFIALDDKEFGKF